MSASGATGDAGALQKRVEYLGLVLDEEGVAEWEDGRRSVFVRRGDLRELRYELGWRSERPIVQGLFGALLLAVGLNVLAHFVSALFREGNVLLSKPVIGFGTMLPMLGGWALFGALRRGHMVRADLVDGDSRKLLLQGRFDATEFEAFVARAGDLGYSIRMS